MLQTLDMSDNQITGSIPSSIGDLKNLNYLYDFFLWFLSPHSLPAAIYFESFSVPLVATGS